MKVQNKEKIEEGDKEGQRKENKEGKDAKRQGLNDAIFYIRATR